MANIQKKTFYSLIPIFSNNNTPLTIFLGICFLYHGNIFSQKLIPSNEIVNKIWTTTGKNNNKIFVPYIKTVQMYLSETPMSYPVLNINGKSVLTLHFDDIDTLTHDYQYVIEQYNATWEIQNSDTFTFLEGFTYNQIRDYEYSGTTSIAYKHYTLNIPNNDIKLKQTGNYLIKVFENTPENPVFTWRFSLYENKANIYAKVSYTHMGNMFHNRHKINMTIDLQQNQVLDIYNDISVFVLPNNLWYLAKKDIHPQFVRENEITYEFDLNPHNEFRTVNFKELSQNYSDIEEIETIKGIEHIKLPGDNFRVYTDYQKSTDMNGRNYIEKFNSNNANYDAAYFYAYFTLKTDQPLLDGNVYIFGALTQYSFNPWNIMVYNIDKNVYENKMLIKQGFHDYYYVHVNSQTLEIDFDRIEGNAAQTSNDYLIYVYIKDPKTGLDNLVGYTIATSAP